MDRFQDKTWGGSDMNLDPWAPYRGKYPEPTYEESRLIHFFLSKFRLEDDDFDEDDDNRWIIFKDRHPTIPNLRSNLIKFLTQVRQSKGYDVDLRFDFSAVPGWELYGLFVPCSLDEQRFRDEATAATEFAVGEINAAFIGKKNYEVVSVDKLVSIDDNSGWLTTSRLLLLTFTAKVIATADLEAFQAMVACAGAGDTTPFRLKEWKFKPTPIHQL